MSGIAGAAVGSIGLAGFAVESSIESKENGGAPPLGKRVQLKDGRKLHVRDTNDDVAAAGAPPATMTVVFEAAQGETLLEWEQVVQSVRASNPHLRFVTQSGVRDPKRLAHRVHARAR